MPKQGPRSHRIVRKADIQLTAPTWTISNNGDLTGARLVIEGAGFSVIGAEGISPFTIDARTEVTMNRITVTGCTVLNTVGGNIYNAGKLKLLDSTVTDNRAGGVAGGVVHENGGRIYNTATLIVKNSTISYNFAFDHGAGIYNTGTMTIAGSTIIHNLSNLGDGGAIYNDKGSLTIGDSTFEHNLADFSEGISNRGKMAK